MAMQKLSLLIPVLLITIGAGLLLSALGIAPQLDWLWILGLIVSGVLLIAIVGFDKATFVAGTTLIITGFLSVLRQTGRLPLNQEIPILVITVGVLSLTARHPAIPRPKWIVDHPVDEDSTD